MARISTYDQDSTVTGTDKLLGTDSATGQTKNFSKRKKMKETEKVPFVLIWHTYIYEQ